MNSVAVFSDRIFSQHDTGAHPESVARITTLWEELPKLFDIPITFLTSPVAEESFVVSLHTPEQIAWVKNLAEDGGGWIDSDTFVAPASYSAALRAIGNCLYGVDQVMDGRLSHSLHLVRPPGHHATDKQSMGFCLFNNVALAAQYAKTRYRADKILIVDWDVHHGNGTQDIFYARDDVFYLSIHRFPFYPGTGDSDETGSGQGLGYNLNVPVAFGTTREAYLDKFRGALEKAAAKIKPDLILISAGFDAHEQDPIGNLGLKTEDFGAMTTIIKEVAKAYCAGRIVSCLEGGYNLKALAASVAEHTKVLRG